MTHSLDDRAKQPTRCQSALATPVLAQTVNAGHVIEPMLSINDLARILRCSRRSVERMRSSGQLPPPTLFVGTKCPRWHPQVMREWIGAGGVR
jgi:hypothetical protein